MYFFKKKLGPINHKDNNVLVPNNADKYLYGKNNMPLEPITLTSYLPKIDIPIVSLQKYILEKLFIHSDQCLIDCETNSSHGFYELESDSLRLANALKHLGLREGVIFGIYGQNSYQYLTLYLAGMITGAVVYGIASTDSYQEVSNKIIQQNIKFLAVSGKHLPNAKRISEGIPITQKIILFNGGHKLNDKFELYSHLIDSFDPIDDDMVSVPTDPKLSDCLILTTSGCSGDPKPVVFTHYSVVSAIEITSYPQMFGYTQTEVIASYSEFAHQMSIFQILTAISTGSKIVLMPEFESKNFLNYVQKYRISAAILTSSAIVALLKAPEGSGEMSSLTKVISCGSVLSKTIANQLIGRYNHIKDLRQGFFQTECMAPISLMIKNSSEYDSIGVPIPNTKVVIKELETGLQLSANQIGEICVQRSDALLKRYSNRRETVEDLVDSDGWFHTRDLGYYDEDGLMYAIGSVDEMIKSNNQLIPTSEVEAILQSHSAVIDAVVLGIVDNSGEQLAKGFIVLKAELREKAFDTEILDYVNNQLPKKKRLHSLYVMNFLPKTSFGKVIKRQLRDELFFKLNKQKF